MRSSQLQSRFFLTSIRMQRIWTMVFHPRPSGHGALKNPISRSSWTTSLERQPFLVCFCLVRIRWCILLRDMICGVAWREKNTGWEGCHVVEEQLTIRHANFQSAGIDSPCTEPSEGVHNWRNVKSEWWCYMIFDSDLLRRLATPTHPFIPCYRDVFFLVSQLQKSWTRWTTTWTVARL